jgi:hypothetical protein
MKLKLFILTLTVFSLIATVSDGQNRLNSRLFHTRPSLFNSDSKVENFHLTGYVIHVLEPVDKRSHFYGEVVYRNKKVHPFDVFFQSPVEIEIQHKITSDLLSFGMSYRNDSSKTNINISTDIEVFYPEVIGFIWGKSFAKVRLLMTATSKGTILISKHYESFYITDGTDKGFEGKMMMTIEQGANVTIGMALRKALDEFYTDLKEKIKS